jgi:tetrahydromethanopterin S-methyltransferase subunit G
VPVDMEAKFNQILEKLDEMDMKLDNISALVGARRPVTA